MFLYRSVRFSVFDIWDSFCVCSAFSCLEKCCLKLLHTGCTCSLLNLALCCVVMPWPDSQCCSLSPSPWWEGHELMGPDGTTEGETLVWKCLTQLSSAYAEPGIMGRLTSSEAPEEQPCSPHPHYFLCSLAWSRLTPWLLTIQSNVIKTSLSDSVIKLWAHQPDYW